MKPVFAHNRVRFDGWTMVDPESEGLSNAMHAARYGLKGLTQSQAYLLCEAAAAFVHFATHPAGTESVIKQLRELRRTLDARRSKP